MQGLQKAIAYLPKDFDLKLGWKDGNDGQEPAGKPPAAKKIELSDSMSDEQLADSMKFEDDDEAAEDDS